MPVLLRYAPSEYQITLTENARIVCIFRKRRGRLICLVLPLQRHDKFCPFSQLAFHVDIAIVERHDFLRDGEA